MKQLKVSYENGLIYIDSDDICFSYIPEMYTQGRAGIGLQVSENIQRKIVIKMCVKIAEAVEAFNSELDNEQ